MPRISPSPDIVIRPATAADDDAIAEVHRAAFPTEAEAELVTMLEADGDIRLSLVAEQATRIVGSNIVSNGTVVSDGQPLKAWAVGPIGILPDMQRQGIGSLLMRAAIDQARASGVQLLFLLGNPLYYCRFGFSAAAARPFASPYAGPHFQALLLDKALEPPQSGRAEYAPAFAHMGER